MAKLSTITNELGEGPDFTPAGTQFSVVVTAGSVLVKMQMPGETAWTYVSDVVDGRSVASVYSAGTTVSTAVDVAGSKYKLCCGASYGGLTASASAQAWE